MGSSAQAAHLGAQEDRRGHRIAQGDPQGRGRCGDQLSSGVPVGQPEGQQQKDADHGSQGRAVGHPTGAHGGLMSRQTLTCVLVAAITFGAPSTLSPAKGARIDVTADALLAAVYEEIIRGHLDAALQGVEGLIRVRPNFRLAHLIKGDLLLARARPINTIGAAPNVPETHVEGLRAEAFARLRAYRERPPADLVPRYLLQLREDQKYARSEERRVGKEGRYR